MHSGLTFTVDQEPILANDQFNSGVSMYSPQLTNRATVTPPPLPTPLISESHGVKRVASPTILPPATVADSESELLLPPPPKKQRSVLSVKKSTNTSTQPPLCKTSRKRPTILSVKTEKKESRSTTSKNQLNSAVLNGTFERHPIQWENYKKKLRDLDPYCEVNENNPTQARLVRHSRCAKYITMSVPYDVGRFKEHLETCNAKMHQSVMANTRTLDAMFSSSTSQLGGKHKASGLSHLGTEKLNSMVVLWPCPGLTEADDERISQYLGRTQLGSAGGISERILAHEMFGTSLYSSLNESQKEIVTLRQQQTHRWRNDHLHQRIFAVGETKCCENISAPNDGDRTTIKPCVGCKALLSLPAFQTAISKSQPSDKNRAFVPHRHQNTAFGNMQIKTLRLGNLFSEVRFYFCECVLLERCD